MVVLGWILIVLGVVFLLAGLIEALRKMFAPASERAGLPIGEVILGLLKGGLGLLAVGLLLLVLGLQLIGVDILVSPPAAPSPSP